MAISMILTLSKNGSLGETSPMGWTVKEDKIWFRNVTKNVGTVVMGRKTFETMDNRPLPNRVNYIITHNPEKIEKTDSVIPITLEDFRALKLKDYCVVGGYEIYHEFLKDAAIVYISHHKNVEVEGRVLNLDMSKCVLFDRSESEDLIKEVLIQHPYISKRISYEYSDESPFISQAKDVWLSKQLPGVHLTVSFFINGGEIVTQGTNYEYHDKFGCVRKKLNMPTGVGYELCEGCQPVNHSESSAIIKIKQLDQYKELKGSIEYLYGHWWCCEDCTKRMDDAGVVKVIISREWTKKFLKIADL